MPLPVARACVTIALAGLALLASRLGSAHESEGGEEAEGPVYEIGGAGEWSVRGSGVPNYGPTIGMEVTPIEDWLEIEGGLAALATSGHTEYSLDLVFKKPFTLSETTEFMFGLGPSFSKTLTGPDRGIARGLEVAGDFMFWPRRNFGWFIEPTWTIVPRTHGQSLGLSIGLTMRTF